MDVCLWINYKLRIVIVVNLGFPMVNLGIPKSSPSPRRDHPTSQALGRVLLGCLVFAGALGTGAPNLEFVESTRTNP